MKKKDFLRIGIIIFIIGAAIIISSLYFYFEIASIAHKQNVDEKDIERQQEYSKTFNVILIIGAILAWIGGIIIYKNYPPIEENEKVRKSYNLPEDSGFKCPICEGQVKFDIRNNKWYCIDCEKYL